MIRSVLEILSGAFGPAGCETAVAETIQKIGSSYSSSCQIDRAGNVIFSHKPQRSDENTKTVMIVAHMDEVGFMINEIDDEGYLHFSALGDIDPRALCGRNVLVGDEIHQVMGVVASKAIHHQTAEERAKITEIDDMYIDIGANSRETAEKEVSIGDFGTFWGHFHAFGEEKKYYHGKALDNRAGCAVMLEFMSRLADGSLQSPHQLYFCFTVRGAVGPSGAGMAADAIRPDVAVVVDATVAADLPGVEGALRMSELNHGAALAFLDEKTIYSEKLVTKANRLALERGIAVQVKGKLMGGKDAAEIQKRRIGAEVLALCVPVRYGATASSVVCESDINAIVDLLAALLESPLEDER